MKNKKAVRSQKSEVSAAELRELGRTKHALAKFLAARDAEAERNFSPAACASCAAKDARIAALERENEQLRWRLGEISTALNLEAK